MGDLKIKLSDLRIHAHWADAPMGALLQVYLPEISAEPMIGFRCDQSKGFDEQSLKGLLLLTGDAVGKMISGEENYIAMGVDVSHAVELCVSSLRPAKFRVDTAKRGDVVFVLSHKTMANAVLVAADLPENGRFGYVRVDTGAQTASTPNWLPTHPSDGSTKLVSIGNIAVMPKLEWQVQSRTPSPAN